MNNTVPLPDKAGALVYITSQERFSYQRLFQKAYQYIRSIVLFFYMVNIHFCQVNKVNFSEYSVETRECCDYYIMIIKTNYSLNTAFSDVISSKTG